MKKVIYFLLMVFILLGGPFKTYSTRCEDPFNNKIPAFRSDSDLLQKLDGLKRELLQKEEAIKNLGAETDTNFADVMQRMRVLSRFLQDNRNEFFRRLSLHSMKELVFANLQYTHPVKIFIQHCQDIINNEQNKEEIKLLVHDYLVELATVHHKKTIFIISNLINQYVKGTYFPEKNHGLAMDSFKNMSEHFVVKDIVSIFLTISDETIKRQIIQYLKQEFEKLSDSYSELVKRRLIHGILSNIALKEIETLFPNTAGIVDYKSH